MENGSKIIPEIKTIDSAEQLVQLAELVNANDKNDFNGKIVKLEKDIDLNGIVWVPIGINGKQFNGIFDGNGKIISGIRIDSSCNCQGLFGDIGFNGKIKNLKVINSHIKGGSYVGGIAGKNKGKISNSCYLGTVTGNIKVGGLVGVSDGTISCCYSCGAVTGNGDDGNVGNIGGLVGCNCYNKKTCGVKSGNISNCYSISKVIGTKDNIGGLIGQNAVKCKIINSYYKAQTSNQNNKQNGEGKATKDMKRQDTFFKWDFDKIWEIDPTKNNGYPHLRETIVSNPSNIHSKRKHTIGKPRNLHSRQNAINRKPAKAI